MPKKHDKRNFHTHAFNSVAKNCFIARSVFTILKKCDDIKEGYLTSEVSGKLMVSIHLDATDRRILKELQANGRITNVELSRRVGISAPPCLRRVRALEEAGVITGYYALLDEKKLGFNVTAFAMVGLGSQTEQDLLAFEKKLQSWPIVRECYMLSGDVDFILKCIAPDLESFQQFVVHELTAAPNVASVKTTFSLRRCRFEPGVPLQDEPEEKPKPRQRKSIAHSKA